ncbi:MAG: class I SAM-dependent methyltransferase [Propionicimonas sp.]|nr:class I SAM-dependent methyltransferase [Propionicimonas sp.]
MDETRATSFGSAAGAYQLGRPEYVDEHVAWLVEGVTGRVLDLAAGSGKLTRAVARLGFAVLAVDPDQRMLAEVGDLPTLAGRADAIPAADDSFAAVTVGQAWHWFDPATAGPEIARVLEPGGRLGLICHARRRSGATRQPSAHRRQAELRLRPQHHRLPGRSASLTWRFVRHALGGGRVGQAS